MFVKNKYHLLIICFLFFVSLYTYFYVNKEFKSIYNIDDSIIKGRIIKIHKNNDYYKITLKVSKNEKIICYLYDKELKYNLNDLIKITGELKIVNRSSIFNGFDYQKYLKNNNIYYTCDIKDIKLIEKNDNTFYRLKNMIIKQIEKRKTYPYLYAFILGDNSYINNDIKTSYQENGISHLFAISGMHISFFVGFLLIILRKLNIKELFIYIVILLFLLFYMFLVDFSPSVIRSFFMFLFILIKNKLKLNIKTIYILLLVLSITLLINPFFIYHIGFLYSFTISAFLIIFKPKNILSVSFISFLGSLPITLYYFNQINLLSILYNLFFVTFVSIIIFPMSFLVFIFSFIDPLYFLFINVLENISLFFNDINSFKFILKKINIYFLIIYYLIIVLSIKNKRYLMLFIFLIIHYNYNIIFNINFITMIDVGQGDSILISLRNTAVLIDTGEAKNNNGNNIISYLKSRGIKKLKYLIISHGDSDHIGEAINMIENFKVENVVFNCGTYSKLENNLIIMLKKKKIKIYSCISKLNIDKYNLEFLNTKIYDNENDNSSVIYFNYNNIKFLFMGDAGIKTEKDMLEKYDLKDIDFIKIGHHGSNTSSSEEFINKINPKYSLISVGKNNRYGHPKESLLNILNNSKVYRTDKDGSIEIKLDKSRYKINIPLS